MEILSELIIVMAITIGAIAIMFAVFCYQHYKQYHDKKIHKEDKDLVQKNLAK